MTEVDNKPDLEFTQKHSIWASYGVSAGISFENIKRVSPILHPRCDPGVLGHLEPNDKKVWNQCARASAYRCFFGPFLLKRFNFYPSMDK